MITYIFTVEICLQLHQVTLIFDAWNTKAFGFVHRILKYWCPDHGKLKPFFRYVHAWLLSILDLLIFISTFKDTHCLLLLGRSCQVT